MLGQVWKSQMAPVGASGCCRLAPATFLRALRCLTGGGEAPAAGLLTLRLCHMRSPMHGPFSVHSVVPKPANSAGLPPSGDR